MSEISLYDASIVPTALALRGKKTDVTPRVRDSSCRRYRLSIPMMFPFQPLCLPLTLPLILAVDQPTLHVLGRDWPRRRSNPRAPFVLAAYGSSSVLVAREDIQGRCNASPACRLQNTGWLCRSVILRLLEVKTGFSRPLLPFCMICTCILCLCSSCALKAAKLPWQITRPRNVYLRKMFASPKIFTSPKMTFLLFSSVDNEVLVSEGSGGKW